ncbi:MAG: S8 family serine peptidase, partial [Promethearchaeota archaeon]
MSLSCEVIDSLKNNHPSNTEISELQDSENEYYDFNNPTSSSTRKESVFSTINGLESNELTGVNIPGQNEGNNNNFTNSSETPLITTWDDICHSYGFGSNFNEHPKFETSLDSRIKIKNDKISMIIGFDNSLNINEKTRDSLLPINYRIEKTIAKLNAMVISVPVSSLGNFIEFWGSRKEIRYIEPSLIYSIDSTPNDPNWYKQWGAQRIKTDLAWDIQKGNPSSVLVAVIDTGIDYTHPDLSDRYVALGYDWVNHDNNPMDDNSHGTHCAGIIAATINNSLGIAGIANVQIMAEKFLNAQGTGSDFNAAEAIIHAVDAGADILS